MKSNYWTTPPHLPSLVGCVLSANELHFIWSHFVVDVLNASLSCAHIPESNHTQSLHTHSNQQRHLVRSEHITHSRRHTQSSHSHHTHTHTHTMHTHTHWQRHRCLNTSLSRVFTPGIRQTNIHSHYTHAHTHARTHAHTCARICTRSKRGLDARNQESRHQQKKKKKKTARSRVTQSNAGIDAQMPAFNVRTSVEGDTPTHSQSIVMTHSSFLIAHMTGFNL